MNRENILVSLFGFPGCLMGPDPMVWDRWRWVRGLLKWLKPGYLLDFGCGRGAMVFGAAKMGWKGLGITPSDDDHAICWERYGIMGLGRNVSFGRGLPGAEFQVLLCCEVLEHIEDDAATLRQLASTLRMGGAIYITAPSLSYRPIDKGDSKWGPGMGHVRKGYSPATLSALCLQAGIRPTRFFGVSGFVSQKLTGLIRAFPPRYFPLVWLLTLPLRILPPLVDPWLTPLLKWPWYSLGMEGVKVYKVEGKQE